MTYVNYKMETDRIRAEQLAYAELCATEYLNELASIDTDELRDKIADALRVLVTCDAFDKSYFSVYIRFNDNYQLDTNECMLYAWYGDQRAVRYLPDDIVDKIDNVVEQMFKGVI